MRALLVSLLSLSLGAMALCQTPNSDFITSLPGLLKQPSFKMYSGYLSGSGTNMLHYWFIHSQHAYTDPLIIWLSGEPGCSALYSTLTSNGPFMVQPDGINLDYNPNSWNLNANLLYIDAPVGTGFSYSLDGSYKSNDSQVTEDHFQALLSFFTEYPNSTINHIYLAGDGYAGVYVPLLLQRLDSVSKELPLSFEGFAVGNPLTSLVQLDNSFAYYAYEHGIIGERLWTQLNISCCSEGHCNFHNNTDMNCIKALNETRWDVSNIGINPYRVNGDCSTGIPVPLGMAAQDGFYHYSAGVQHIFSNKSFMQMERKSIKGIPKQKLKADLTCVNATAVTKYLNSPYVREALHITDESPQWQMCNVGVDLHYTRQFPDMYSIYQALLDTYKYRLAVYNGDQDAVYNFLGNERFVNSLNRQEEVQWRPWLYKDTLSQDQVAGFVKEYDNIAFLTVKNAGFWAPRDQPIATSLLIYNFIYKRPF